MNLPLRLDVVLLTLPLALASADALAKDKKSRNLALGRPTKFSSEESGKNNLGRNANDGDTATRWCAAGSQTNEWWQVDLGKAVRVRAIRIHWEAAGTAYRYKVEASTDGKAWRGVVDSSGNKKVERIRAHQIDSADTRYLRVTFLGSNTGKWGSFWEFEAYTRNLPPLPKSVKTAKPGAGADVKAPKEFDVTMFATPPTVNYPVCLAAAATGEVFVGVDPQGSLGKKPGEGKVLRCLDTNGDGKADKVNVFAKMDHPRGLIYDDGSLWVLHPPMLSVYHDDDGDGAADRHKVLITGISTDLVKRRGADHTTNGIRMGIDGWIYIAVGDFGFTEAVAADGTNLSRRGGGIVRIRPDGAEMEIFAWGLRNILDVCIDPLMNIFTRDNTNDGGGWNVRVSHILQSAHYGYPSLFTNFTEETMPPLADYGGGSGCGGMFLHEPRWPKPFGNALYTCDWGRSIVFRHNLPAAGATFAPHQEKFLGIQRPTDIDVDGSGRMYVSSWKNGSFSYSGPNVGYVARITPKGFEPIAVADVKKLDDAKLIEQLASPSAAVRLQTQRTILRRGRATDRTGRLVGLATSAKSPIEARVAAIFTLKQLDGPGANAALVKMLEDKTIREFALLALTDRKTQLGGVAVEALTTALRDENPRVRARALIGLGRLRLEKLSREQAAKAILPLTVRSKSSPPQPTQKPVHAQADPGRVLPHLAVQALVAIGAADECLAALDGPYADGALWALRWMHNERAVSGLLHRLSTTRNQTRRRAILTALVRLYHREGKYTSGWWGTRPDRSGPYFDRKPWAQSERIAAAIRTAKSEADPETAKHIIAQLARHKVRIAGLPDATRVAENDTPQKPIAVAKIDKNNKNLIANMTVEKAAARALAAKGDAERGRPLFTSQSCVACHTYANGQTPKGPHLVDIGERYKPAELVESMLRPGAKIAQGFDTYTFVTSDGQLINGFVASESAESVEIRLTDGTSKRLRREDLEQRRKQRISIMPVGVVNSLTPEQLADLLAYLQSLK